MASIKRRETFTCPLLEALPSSLEHYILSWLDMEDVVPLMWCSHRSHQMIESYLHHVHYLRVCRPPSLIILKLLALHTRSLRILNMIHIVQSLSSLCGHASVLHRSLTLMLGNNRLHFQHLELPSGCSDSMIPWSLLPMCPSLTGLTIPPSPRDAPTSIRSMTIQQCVLKCSHLSTLHLDYHHVDVPSLLNSGMLTLHSFILCPLTLTKIHLLMYIGRIIITVPFGTRDTTQWHVIIITSSS
jgi:hypothetical protein